METTDKMLDNDLAKISIVKSLDAVSLARDTSDLYDMQEKINESVGNVNVLKTILEDSEPYEINPVAAAEIDKQLQAEEVPLSPQGEDVVGAEQLGLTLMPSQYKESRIAGCESFLGEATLATSILIKRMMSNLKNQYLLLTQSTDSLQERLNILGDLIAKETVQQGTVNIDIGYRLFNLFRINNQVNEKWVSNFSKVENVIRALTDNYYKNYTTNLTSVFSYFGGFEGLSKEEAEARFLRLPLSITDNVFKECTYPNKEHTNKDVIAKNSVVLMGDYFFMNTVGKARVKANSLDDINLVIDDLIKDNTISFISNAEVNYGKAPTVKNLGTSDMKLLHKLMSNTITDIVKIHTMSEKLEIGASDYASIVKTISSNEWDGLEERVTKAFERIVMFKANELSKVRSDVTNYLVLLINGLIQLCNDSIESYLNFAEGE